jgi:hypothetical protein
MTTPCYTPITKSGKNGGPATNYKICCSKVYAQTLFLGCSIKSFNASLAWGSESSRLTVELVYDSCKYPSLTDINGTRVPRPTQNNAYVTARQDNSFSKDENGNSLIPAKVYYVASNGAIVSRYWSDPDPGFYADMPDPNLSIDIVGTPVYFIYDDFSFNGIVKSWEKNNSSSGTGSYTVIIESPSYLLSQTNMILSDYVGSIHSKVASDSTWYSENQYLGFPSLEYSNDYTGLIGNQNIPNLINIYGYLEDNSNFNGTGGSSGALFDPITRTPEYSYGRSMKNDRGIPVWKILTALYDLTSTGEAYVNNIPNQAGYRKLFRYAPYARIVGKPPLLKNTTNIYNWQNTDRFRMGLIEPKQLSVDGVNVYLSPFMLDLSNLVDNGFIPSEYRMSETNLDILSLVNNIADNTGQEVFISLEIFCVGNFTYPVIKVNTYSNLKTPGDTAVQSFIDGITDAGATITATNKGEEFNNTKPVRSVYIGGKQQRLYQVKNVKYAVSQSTLRYNPYTKTFAQVQHYGSSGTQQYRFPDLNNLRNLNMGYVVNTGLGITGRVDARSVGAFNTMDTWATNIFRGNYHQPLNVVGTQISPAELSYPSSLSDAICPFFGTDPFNKLARPVYHNYNEINLQTGNPEINPFGNKSGLGFVVEFSAGEIENIVGYNLIDRTPIGISELEFRAAMSGPDAYISFITAVAVESVSLGISPSAVKLDIYSKVLRFLVNFGPSISMGLKNHYNAYSNSQSGGQSVPTGPASSIYTDQRAYGAFVKLQQFLKNIADEYYGKQFMISVPSPQIYTDINTAYNVTGTLPNGDTIPLTGGSQKIYSSFEIATDGAWEEPGNVIDDTLIIGTSDVDEFTNDNGLIQTILGYSNLPLYNYNREFEYALYNNTINFNTNFNFYNFTKFDAYRSAGVVHNWSTSNPAFYWEPSLMFSGDKYKVVPYRYAFPDSYNSRTIPANLASKVYVKADVEENLVFAKYGNSVIPKIIVKTDKIDINPISPDTLSVSAAIAEFMLPEYSATNNAVISIRAKKILAISNRYVNNGAGFTAENYLQDSGNKQYNNLSIAPKAAMPAFAAIPVKDNRAVYGPWISSPDMFINDIFSYLGDDAAHKLRKLETLIGGVNVNVDPSLVPWNYGSMVVLDMVAIQLATQDNNYQLKGETGQLSYYGTPIFNLGNELKAAAYTFGGPVINNIQTQISENGPLTTYTFRTYTKKFSLFNKENADRLKEAGEQNIRFEKQLRQQYTAIREQLSSIAGRPTLSNFDLGASVPKLRSYSPLNVLVGYSSPFFSRKATKEPKFLANRFDNTNIWTGDSIRQLTTVTLQNIREVPSEFENSYSSKAFMSMDGLLQPISFYPTLSNSTTPLKKYYTSGCPFCNGTKQYSFTLSDGNNRSLWCDFCSGEVAGSEAGPSDASNGRLPPFILSNEADSSIIRDPNAVSALLDNFKRKRINYVNLNPLIMPVGELRNQYAQPNDFTAHHIDIVGRSQAPPQSLSFYQNLDIDQNGREYSDQNNGFADADINSKFFDNVNNRTNTNITQMNYRFLGLRGPLIMAGWGFDTEGYPVPNASGEPKGFFNNGQPWRISSLTQQQTGTEGAILGKNQEWSNDEGRWSEPTREDKFYQGWGLRPDSWPVGPVDLRWDHAKKVWTTPQPYKLVDIQLEDDLAPPFPARGFLNAVDRKTPLPNGLRRMVFVKDSSETFGAPRGAKILCYYDEGSGFYEPISRQNITALGYIQSNGSARILNAYAKGYDPVTSLPESPEQITVQYVNPLNFPLTTPNQTGVFMYIRNSWTLISTYSCN